MSAQEQNSLTIGRVAKQADVTIDTIRFYERRGLLPKPQRAANGYRLYPPNTIARLHFIRRAKGLGFALDEIRALLKLQDARGTKADVKALTNRKLEQIEIKITDLQLMRDALRKLNAQCSGTGSVSGCPIIKTLSANSSLDSDNPISE
jgi:MerR family copper efflux transcriptional regulator